MFPHSSPDRLGPAGLTCPLPLFPDFAGSRDYILISFFGAVLAPYAKTPCPPSASRKTYRRAGFCF